jgi:hypothetical protein
VERFLARTHPHPAPDSVLASILTVKWSGEEESVRRAFDREVIWSRGQPLEFGTGGLAAAFDGPGRAVQCGTAVVRATGSSARAGVHIGECFPCSGAGPVETVSAAIAEAAAPGEVRVSRTVVDLVPGSGIAFEDRGTLRWPDGRGIAMLAVAR